MQVFTIYPAAALPVIVRFWLLFNAPYHFLFTTMCIREHRSSNASLETSTGTIRAILYFFYNSVVQHGLSVLRVVGKGCPSSLGKSDSCQTINKVDTKLVTSKRFKYIQV